MLTLTFFKNENGVPIADLYLDERRLIATNHPATIVAAMFAMRRVRLTVTTSIGTRTANLPFRLEGAVTFSLATLELRLQLNPRHYQFLDLASDEKEQEVLKGLDLFSQENWFYPNSVADEYLRTAYEHLPPDVIKHPLISPPPAGWKRTLKNRNRFIYFPEC